MMLEGMVAKDVFTCKTENLLQYPTYIYEYPVPQEKEDSRIEWLNDIPPIIKW